MLEKVREVNRGLAAKFPDGIEPFRIMTRLFEEGGELAQQVNLFENAGIKRDKYGEPDRAKLAMEVRGVLLAVFQLVDYYDLYRDLEASLDLALPTSGAMATWRRETFAIANDRDGKRPQLK